MFMSQRRTVGQRGKQPWKTLQNHFQRLKNQQTSSLQNMATLADTVQVVVQLKATDFPQLATLQIPPHQLADLRLQMQTAQIHAR